ncbi:MAG: recombination protein RecR [Elusimicrobia bacterium]|nr:recombination protein RecR [Elusimicrobiota bacterium]
MRSLDRLISNLKRLPGIGPKQAERISLHLLRRPPEETRELVASLEEARRNIRFCRECHYLSEEPLCDICRDGAREPHTICVVEQPGDLVAVEKSRSYRGLYHVLHGTLSPLEGVAPKDIRAESLLERLKRSDGRIREVVLAMDPDMEGEATALYLAQQLRSYPVKVTKIARGIPLGADLDYLDEGTLTSAFEGRREF